ncbi:MAG: TlpA family protein disulfide reductase [Candidatus Solibacter usitatus]|nr:TlpA family protein disulfide reductase [Candidatus Solibacter usitatus]
MKQALLILALAFRAVAQDMPEEEQRRLSEALAEAGSSPIEFLRALEKHLEAFPKTSKRVEIERALVKAAIEAKDERRIVLYGERVLEREQDDLQVLERVARALLSADDKESAKRALPYARRYGEMVSKMRLQQETPGRMSKGQWLEEVDRGASRALALEARATGNLGQAEEAAALAARSFQVYPSGEAAREAARWLIRMGKEAEAVRRLADAFTVADPKTTEADRARDRQRMGELYRKTSGSEKGLGDLILESYDRTAAVLIERQQRLAESDPNSKAINVLDFTISGLSGEKLRLSTLKGKAVVFDFWATWCGPCRAQHPLYDQVKQKFKGNPHVVFLSVNTDEDRSVVEPFLRENRWSKTVFFEDGLSRNMQISSIPTTIVLNRRGELISRMNGFLPDRFVKMLSERIEEALK